MVFQPVPLSAKCLPKEELAADKKNCRKFGPCGVGEKALYLNSFYIDRRYYIPFESVTRVFKRVAMSKGGFSRKGVFASIPYLVAEYDGGKEKQCNFKYEEEVDQLLACLKKERPDIKLVSASAEERLRRRERELAARKIPELSKDAKKSLEELQRAEVFLEERPELSLELSEAARNKRAYLCSDPSYRWVALAITLLGTAALIYGVWTFLQHGQFGLYFTLFGLAAIFLFSGFSVLPTSRNNKAFVMRRAEEAQRRMEEYLKGYGRFPVPPRYAHPVVLRRMGRAIEEGRASYPTDALEAVKRELKALNSSVEVEQEEYEEVMTVKPMFLNEDYQ